MKILKIIQDFSDVIPSVDITLVEDDATKICSVCGRFYGEHPTQGTENDPIGLICDHNVAMKMRVERNMKCGKDPFEEELSEGEWKFVDE